MIRKWISQLMIAVLMMTALNVTITAQSNHWNDDILYTPGYSLEGKGTNDEPYIIKNALDLGFFDYLTTQKTEIEPAEGGAPYRSASYKIANTAGELDMSSREWVPIPSFSGSFDGNGIPIRGLTVCSDKGGYIGMFESLHANNNVITGLALQSIRFSVTAGEYLYLGGITGNVFNYGGSVNDSKNNETVTISNSYVTGSVSCTATVSDYVHIGGIVGDSNAHAKPGVTGLDILTVSGCYTDLTITAALTKNSSFATGYLGGIIGAPNSNADTKLADCYTLGSITGEAKNGMAVYAGGLFGSMAGDSKIDNCLAGMTVATSGDGVFYVGSVGGALTGELKNCFTLSENVPAFAEMDQYVTAAEVSPLVMVDNASVRLPSAAELPLAERIEKTSAWESNHESVSVGETGELTVHDTASGGTAELTADITLVPKKVNSGDPATAITGKRRGKITILSTPEQIESFSQNTAEGQYLPGALYLLGCDIDMAGQSAQPIGTKAFPFMGRFDGRGKTIRNVTVTMDGSKTYYGLFGRVQNSDISNFTLEHVTVGETDYEITEADACVGGAAGYAKNSTFSDITVSDFRFAGINKVIYSNVCAGGIVGQTAGTDTAVRNCNAQWSLSYLFDSYLEKDQSSGVSFGGIVGDATGGEISGCNANFAAQRTQGESVPSAPTTQMAGIIGHAYSLHVKDCSATIDFDYQGVNSSANIAGIAGLMDSGAQILNCQAYGRIKVDEHGDYPHDENGAFVGGIIAWHGEFGDSAVENCFSAVDYTAVQEQRYPSGNIAGLALRPGSAGVEVRTCGNFFANTGDWSETAEGLYLDLGAAGTVRSENNYRITVSDLRVGQQRQPFAFSGVYHADAAEGFVSPIPPVVTELFEVTLSADEHPELAIEGLAVTAEKTGTLPLSLKIAKKDQINGDEAVLGTLPVDVELTDVKIKQEGGMVTVEAKSEQAVTLLIAQYDITGTRIKNVQAYPLNLAAGVRQTVIPNFSNEAGTVTKIIAVNDLIHMQPVADYITVEAGK